MLKLFFGSTV